MITVGLAIPCKLCQKTFFICKSCYRGHLYCSPVCGGIAKKINRRKAQKKYEGTGTGKAKRARRQANYRKNKALSSSLYDKDSIVTHFDEALTSSHLIEQTPKIVTPQKKVTHPSSNEKKIPINTSPSGRFSVQNSKQKCCLCHKEIDRWEKFSENSV